MTRSAKCALMPNMVINTRNKDDFLKYLPVIQAFLKDVKSRKGLGHLADQLGYNQSRLSQFLSGCRQPTRYYILKFVRGGHISVEQFLQGKDWKSLSPEEQEFWREVQILEDPELMDLLKKARDRKLDIVALLKAALPSK